MAKRKAAVARAKPAPAAKPAAPYLRNPGDSIEGDRILVAGRKIMPAGRPRKDEASGRLLFSIEVKRGANGVIIKAFNPPVPVVRSQSAVVKDAKIGGDHLSGSSTKPFRVDEQKKGGAGRTHSHSGQNWTMEGQCFLEIVTNFLKQAMPLPATNPAPLLLT